MNGTHSEGSAEAVTECPGCSHIWTISDVEAILTAKTNGNRWLMVSIFVILGGITALGLSLFAGALILVLGFSVWVWAVKVNRRPLRTMTLMPLDESNREALKNLDRKTLRKGGVMLRDDPRVRGGVFYQSLTRGLWMRLFLIAMIPLAIGWFAVAGFFQRRFKSTTHCPGCLDLRVTINFLPKDKEEAIHQLREMEASPGELTR